MMADEDKLVKAGVEAAMKPFSELLEKLAGPAAEEIGLTLKDHVRVFRFKRQLRLFERVKEMLTELKIEPGRVPLKLLDPIIANASVEEDDVLQDKWAYLLANAAINREGIHPSFPEILKQLSSRDAAYLDALCEFQLETVKAVGELSLLSGKKERERQLKICDDRLSLRFAAALGMKFDDPDMAREMLNARFALSGFEENLLRLGLIYLGKDKRHTLTIFGLEFVGSCRQPNPNYSKKTTSSKA